MVLSHHMTVIQGIPPTYKIRDNPTYCFIYRHIYLYVSYDVSTSLFRHKNTPHVINTLDSPADRAPVVSTMTSSGKPGESHDVIINLGFGLKLGFPNIDALAFWFLSPEKGQVVISYIIEINFDVCYKRKH